MNLRSAHPLTKNSCLYQTLRLSIRLINNAWCNQAHQWTISCVRSATLLLRVPVSVEAAANYTIRNASSSGLSNVSNQIQESPVLTAGLSTKTPTLTLRCFRCVFWPNSNSSVRNVRALSNTMMRLNMPGSAKCKTFPAF